MNRLILVLLCFFPLSSMAFIRANVEYVSAKKTPFISEHVKHFVQRFVIDYEDQTYVFTTDETFLNWDISQDDMEYGEVIFFEGDKSENRWEFSFPELQLNVGFWGFNDPRIYTMTFGKETLYMANGEPDCNSVYTLLTKEEEYLWEVKEKDIYVTGEASHPCEKSNWLFEIKIIFFTKFQFHEEENQNNLQ